MSSPSPQGQPVTAEDIALIEKQMNAYDKLADELGSLACGQAEARERETADRYRRILAALRGAGQASELEQVKRERDYWIHQCKTMDADAELGRAMRWYLRGLDDGSHRVQVERMPADQWLLAVTAHYRAATPPAPSDPKPTEER